MSGLSIFRCKGCFQPLQFSFAFSPALDPFILEVRFDPVYLGHKATSQFHFFVLQISMACKLGWLSAHATGLSKDNL